MPLFKRLKLNARRALKENWSAATIVMVIKLGTLLLYGLFCALVLSIAGEQLSVSPINSSGATFLNRPSLSDIINMVKLFSLGRGDILLLVLTVAVLVGLYFIVVAPLYLGSVYWHYRLVKGRREQALTVFYYFERFKRYLKAVGLSVSLFIRKILWGVLFAVFPVLLFLGVKWLLGSDRLRLNPISYQIFYYLLLSLLAIITLIVMVCYCAYINKYSLASYFIREEGINISTAIKMSITQTKDFRLSIFWFGLSFAGWWLLSIIIFPCLFYTYTYYGTSKAMYCNYLIERYKRRTEKTAQLEQAGNDKLSPLLGEETNPNLEDTYFLEKP